MANLEKKDKISYVKEGIGHNISHEIYLKIFDIIVLDINFYFSI